MGFAMQDDARRKRRRRRLAWLALVVAIVAIGGTIRGLAGQVAGSRIYLLPTNSMAPTLLSGDRVRVVEGAGTKDPQGGEIWVFVMPATAHPAGPMAIKRIIGRPGDTVAVRSGRTFGT